MSQTDIINDLLTGHPNEPASNGVVLLLRAEMKSEFKTVHQKLDQHDARFDAVDKRFDEMDKRFDEMDKQFVGIHKQLGGINEQIKSIHESVEMLAQQMAIVVTKLN